MRSLNFLDGRLLAACLLLLTLTIFSHLHSASANNDHNDRHKKRIKSHLSSFDHNRVDKGNEFTGQFAAWTFAVANLSVAFSLVLKGIMRLPTLSVTIKDRIRFFNKRQKKHLMRLHYFLNPVAIILGLLHFGLSSCRSSPFPEWGLAAASALALIGILLRFNILPRIRKSVYRIHTSPLPFGLVSVFLLIGHSLID